MKKLAAIWAVALLGGAASAQNLVTNGSFESNTLASGAYRDMLVGSSDLPGWTIIGVPNTHISQVDSAYAGNPGYTFPAQDGRLWVDLAGYSDNAADGVQQSIATTIGATYAFNFWLGNVSGGLFGTQSAVSVLFSSGGTNFRCVNSASTQTLTWMQCSQTFTATNSSTTFSINNLDPTSDYNNAIDNVSVTLVPPILSSVPENATWLLTISGFGLMGAMLRRRKLATAIA